MEVKSKSASRPQSKAPSRQSKESKGSSEAKAAKSEPKAKEPQDKVEVKSQKEEGPARSAQETSAHLKGLNSAYGQESSGRKLSEARDQPNCIDRAAAAAREGDQAVFLRDERNQDGNNAGHVVLQRGDSYVDPGSGQSYANEQAYREANPQYSEQGRTSGENLQKIVGANTQAERDEAIRAAGLEGLKDERYADASTPDKGIPHNLPTGLADKGSMSFEADKGRGTEAGGAGGGAVVNASWEVNAALPTEKGEFVQAEFRQTGGAGMQGNLKSGPAGANVSDERGQGSTWTATFPKSQLDEGYLPDPQNPQGWHPGTQIVYSKDAYANLGVGANVGPLAAQASSEAKNGSVTGVSKDDEGVIRTFTGEHSSVENSLNVGPSVGLGTKAKYGTVEAEAEASLGMTFGTSNKVEDTHARFTETYPDGRPERSGTLDQMSAESKNGFSAEASARFGFKVGQYETGTSVGGSLGWNGGYRSAEMTSVVYDDGQDRVDTLTASNGGSGQQRQLEIEKTTHGGTETTETSLSMATGGHIENGIWERAGAKTNEDGKGVTLDVSDERAADFAERARQQLASGARLDSTERTFYEDIANQKSGADLGRYLFQRNQANETLGSYVSSMYP